MKPCCRKEAERNLHKHADAAVCDECGNLLTAYGNESDSRKTCEALKQAGIPFDMQPMQNVWVVSKVRTIQRGSEKK